jgi:hypothetical protein
LLCKAKQQRSRWSSANPEANVAEGFGAEAYFQFSQDFGLGDLFELVVQGWLEDPDGRIVRSI